MKRLLSKKLMITTIVIIITIISSSMYIFSAVTPENYRVTNGDEIGYISASRLNVRSQRSIYGSIEGKVVKNERVNIRLVNPDGWAFIEFQNSKLGLADAESKALGFKYQKDTGYVSVKYVMKESYFNQINR